MKIDDLTQLFLDNQSSSETKRAYTRDLKNWFEFLNGREPSSRLALDFRKFLEGTVSSRSAARTQNTVRTFYRFAQLENPFANIRSTKRVSNMVPEIPQPSEVIDMFERCDNARDRAVLALATNGLRASEIADLRLRDWTWNETYGVWVMRVIGKGEKMRQVVANAETAEYVNDYLAEYSRGSNWLIRAKTKGHRVTSRTVWNIVHKWSPNWHPHSFRHFYASRLVDNGAALSAIQDQLGHASIATTQIYIHTSLGFVVGEAKKYGSVAQAGLRPIEGGQVIDLSERRKQVV